MNKLKDNLLYIGIVVAFLFLAYGVYRKITSSSTPPSYPLPLVPIPNTSGSNSTPQKSGSSSQLMGGFGGSSSSVNAPLGTAANPIPGKAIEPFSRPLSRASRLSVRKFRNSSKFVFNLPKGFDYEFSTVRKDVTILSGYNKERNVGIKVIEGASRVTDQDYRRLEKEVLQMPLNNYDPIEKFQKPDNLRDFQVKVYRGRDGGFQSYIAHIQDGSNRQVLMVLDGSFDGTNMSLDIAGDMLSSFRKKQEDESK